MKVIAVNLTDEQYEALRGIASKEFDGNISAATRWLIKMYMRGYIKGVS